MNKELNEKLYSAISEDDIDYDYIAELMRTGADPLGPLMDEYETAIGQLFCEAGCIDIDNDDQTDKCMCDRLPKIIEIFIKNGFDCSRFRKTDGNYNMEMWSLVFSISEGACKTVKILIENGLPAEALDDFIDHFYTDAEFCDGSSMDDTYAEYLCWAFKTIMLCASFPRMLNESEYLRRCIEIDSTNKENEYDLTRFRDYNRYDYCFDVSTIDDAPFGMKNATVSIREKESDRIIWKMHI